MRRVALTKEQRAGLWTIEKLALDKPWHDAKNAAQLACHLIRWVMPEPRWGPPDSSEAAALDAMNGAVSGPFRTPGRQRVCLDPVQVADARIDVTNILSLVTFYINGEPIPVPRDYAPGDHAMTRLYWYSREVGQHAIRACANAADAFITLMTEANKDEMRSLASHWRATGNAAYEATEFLRKYATGNPVVAAADGVAGAILNRVSCRLFEVGLPLDEIMGTILDCRILDACGGQKLPRKILEDLRPAFEAAWLAGEHEFAYAILDDIPLLLEESESD